ncbi:MAG TPA: hypothetical protein VK958_09620 [Methylophilus sp.]|uniref:hypothetical protein n=1 Tax=Methylophilus sp. TaxID=29541 RepID=UPI002C88B7E1|nr:hypothetical protein [Methylophilus sp.]HSH87492.1 hypothetical protein [Methylophilus sp.]
MSEFTQPTPEAASQSNRAAIAKATPGVIGSARWFWWIAGLSIVNTVLIHSGSDTSFIVGLGFTLVADAVFREIMAIALILDVMAIGVFIALGFFAQKGHLWAFITGGILYLFDGLIYVYFQDWLPVAFHAYVLYSLFSGFKTLKTALNENTPPPLTA